MNNEDSELNQTEPAMEPDDDKLLALLREVSTMNDRVPVEAVEAAKLVPELAELDAELAELVEAEAMSGVRSTATTIVSFRLGGAEIEVHSLAAGARVEGTVYDLDITDVAIRHQRDRIIGQVSGPDFVIDAAPRGTCRLEFTTPSGVVATDWFVVA
jgi:hypothetical protein